MESIDQRRLEQNLWKICAIRFLFCLHFVSAVLIPFFRDWGGLDFTRILTLNAWFMFCTFALEVPTGIIADRFGRKVSILLGGFVSMIAALVMISVPRLDVFFLAETLLALGVALMSGAGEALLYDSLVALGREGEAKRAFARFESWSAA